MNKKEQFAKAYENLKGQSAQVDGRRKILFEHSPESQTVEMIDKKTVDKTTCFVLHKKKIMLTKGFFQ